MKKYLLFFCLIIILSIFLFMLSCRTHNNLDNTNLFLSKENMKSPKQFQENTNNPGKYNKTTFEPQQRIFSKLYDFRLQEYGKSNYYSIDILDKKYSCLYHNCYDFESFKYDNQTKTFYVNTMMNLMDCNAHETYKFKNEEGYISHLIFNTTTSDNKVSVKCIGFVISTIKEVYKNGKFEAIYYDNIKIYMHKPDTIKNLKEFEDISLDKELHIKIIKSLANIPED